MSATALYGLLQADQTVTQTVGTRCYPSAAPQRAVLPFVVYHLMGDERLYTFGGPTGIAIATHRVECHAATFDAARLLAATVRTALDSAHGTANGVTVDWCQVAGDDDLGFDEVVQDYAIAVECRMTYREPSQRMTGYDPGDSLTAATFTRSTTATYTAGP